MRESGARPVVCDQLHRIEAIALLTGTLFPRVHSVRLVWTMGATVDAVNLPLDLVLDSGEMAVAG